MKKLISFVVKAEKGFLKKPDINEGMYLTYNMLHKPAILGILGAIIGLKGYKKNQEFGEYYLKLKHIPIGVEPIDAEKGNFQKTIVKYTNTTGFASNEAGGNLIIAEQTLIKPSYRIYLLLDTENENEKKLYHNIKEQKAEYLPYLGKNDYSLWWNKNDVIEYEFEKINNNTESFELKTIFIKDKITVRELKAEDDFDFFDFSDIDTKKFVSFERLPIEFDERLFQYTYKNFAYTNFKLKPNTQLSNIYKLNAGIYVQLN